MEPNEEKTYNDFFYQSIGADKNSPVKDGFTDRSNKDKTELENRLSIANKDENKAQAKTIEI